MPLTPTQLRARLGGVIAFPCTPFDAKLRLDLTGFRKNLRRLAQHDLCAIVVGAGTGEIHSLSTEEHLAVVKAAVAEIGGKRPLLAGVGFSPQTAIDMARASTAAGRRRHPHLPTLLPRRSKRRRDARVLRRCRRGDQTRRHHLLARLRELLPRRRRAPHHDSESCRVQGRAG
jgi:5-dehydro-4-deoxyglucarate dehydratase